MSMTQDQHSLVRRIGSRLPADLRKVFETVVEYELTDAKVSSLSSVAARWVVTSDAKANPKRWRRRPKLSMS
jgi:hypothetical protein